MQNDIKNLEWIKVDDSRGFCGVTIAGDTYFGEWYTRNRKKQGVSDALQEYGYGYSFEKVAPLLPKIDYNIVNFEGVLTETTDSPFKSDIKFLLDASPKETIDELRQRNVNAVMLGNNHCMDFGSDIGLKSRDMFLESGFSVFGFGENLAVAEKPLCLECAGRQVIVFSGYWFRKYREQISKHYASADTPGSACISENLFRQISAYKKEYPDAFIILSPHWGNDFKTPVEDQRVLAKQAIESGVDCIIGHGPHIINDCEWIQGKLVAYSLGNFVFNQTGQDFVKENALPYAYVSKFFISGDLIKLCLYPIDAYNPRTFWQPCPVNDEQFDELVQPYSLSPKIIKRDDIGQHLEIEIYPNPSKVPLPIKNVVPKASGENIFYGITGSIDKKIDQYISIAGEPVAFSDGDEFFSSDKKCSKLFDKYDVLPLDELLKRYPNADVWVTYRKADRTAKRLLKKMAPEKIHFFEADLEYRKSCSFLGHFMSYRKNNFSPCCVTGKCPVVKTSGSIPERIAHWQKYSEQLLDNIRHDRPNDCSKCHHLKYGFWPKNVKLDTLSFASNQPGDVCNFDCMYCFSEKQLKQLKGDKDGFSTYEILSQLSEMPEYNTSEFSIMLSNGEFCANKHCDEIFDILLKTKWRVSFVTNMSIYREKFAEFMETGRVKSILASLDAGTRETFEVVKGRNAFERVVNNLRKYPLSKVNIGLKYIFLEGVNDNLADIDGFYEVVKEVGCKRIVLSSDLFEPFTENMRELVLHLIKKAKADDIIVANSDYLCAKDGKFVSDSYENLVLAPKEIILDSDARVKIRAKKTGMNLKISNLISFRSTLFVAITVLCGAMAWLLLMSKLSNTKIFLLVAGACLLIVLVLSLWKNGRKINACLKNLDK